AGILIEPQQLYADLWTYLDNAAKIKQLESRLYPFHSLSLMTYCLDWQPRSTSHKNFGCHPQPYFSYVRKEGSTRRHHRRILDFAVLITTDGVLD
ncbi:hypothetical protein HETIRDRAFT_328925, partial [Heterobasidion irregulare TC 32-1]